MKRRWIFSLGGLGLLSSPAWCEPPALPQYIQPRPVIGVNSLPCLPPPQVNPYRPCPAPVLPGAPAMPGTPAMPGVPATPGTPATPGAPSTATPTTPGGTGTQPAPGSPGSNAAQNAPGSGQQQQPNQQQPQNQPSPQQDSGQPPAERGGEPPSALRANMYGDAFGGPAINGTVGIPVRKRVGGVIRELGMGPAIFNITPGNTQLTFITPANTVGLGNQPITTDFKSRDLTLRPDGTYSLLENAQDRKASRAYALTLVPAGTAGRLEYIDAASGAKPLNQTNPVVGGATITTFYDFIYLDSTGGTLVLPSPTNSQIGRTKIADDNSPLPRDRIICNYDYFNDVPLSSQGLGVQRISPGFEKTFFDRQASIEVRVPFAATLSNDILSDGTTNTREAEFGNVAVALKALVYGSEALNVACGVGVAIPTAGGIHVYSALDGSEVINIKNEAFVVTPFWSYLFTPCGSSFFFQNWYAIAFNTGGNAILSDPDGKGLKFAGRLDDQHILQIDAQLGYWLVDPATSIGSIQGLAPFVEVHYNTAIGQADRVLANTFPVGPVTTNFNELNVTVGAIVQIGDAVNLTAGAVFPLLNEQNRTFDYQLGVRANIFFGPTLRASQRATQVGTF